MEPVTWELVTWGLVTWGLVTLVSAFIGSYLAGYLRKKGENLATQEDIGKLTEATKKIEAEISSGVWDKQKRWEMKREVLFEATRKISELDDAMSTYSAVLREDRLKQEGWKTLTPSMEEQLGWERAKNDRLIQWNKVWTEFDVSRAFVRIVCGEEAIAAFSELAAWIYKLTEQIVGNPDAYLSGRVELNKRISLVQKAIRKELEVDA